MVREERIGDTYALHHSMVAEPCTVSLVIRGPAVKDRFLVMDRKTGKSCWWQYGALAESAEQAAQKQMSGEHFRQLRGQLDEWEVFQRG
jgi:hypothetical protein